MIRDVTLKAGTDPLIAVLCTHNSAGAAADADGAPTVTLLAENDGGAVTESELGVTVTDIGTGIYKVTVDVDTVITNAHHMSVFWGYVSATIGGVVQNTPITPFRFSPGRDGGSVATDAGNTATTFKVTPAGAGLLLTTQTDDAADALLVFTTGSNAGQVKKVTAFNTGTVFVTVDGAFTNTPAAGDAFILVNF
jgi:hypothetical protein